MVSRFCLGGAMAEQLKLIVDMVSVLGAAAAGGFVTSRLRQPVLLGYLLGGVLVGPAVLGLVGGGSEIKVLAEVGVALLLFALGVEFSIKDLLKVRQIALGGGSLQIVLTIALGGGLAYLTGWVDTLPKAIFLGAVLSLSSTAVVLKSLIERNELQTAHAQAMLGILIVQDLGLGLMLAVLPALTQPPEAIGGAIGLALVKTALFVAAAIGAGIWLIPPLMRQVARTGSQELFVLTVFALCLGVALLTAAIGLGIEMGAFVAGLIISEVEYADQALDKVLPMRDIFATLFFASIGTLIDPAFLLANAPVLVGLVAVAMVGKALIVTPIAALFGYPFKTALIVGLGLNQIGEFSFVLAGVAQGLGLFSERLYALTVGTAAITLVLTPFVLKASPSLFQLLERLPVLGPQLAASQAPRAVSVEEGIEDHIVVAGYGRVGQTLVRLLRSQGYRVLVIDNDEGAVQILRDQSLPYLFGDSASELVLEKAHLERARALAIALPDPIATRLTLKRALGFAPDLDITVRAHANDEIDTLYQLGAKEVVQPEFEASLEMGAHLLADLGSGPRAAREAIEQCRIDHYRMLLPDRPDYLQASDLRAVSDELEGDWFTLEPTSPLVGLSLAQADIRRLTGVSIMAIQRGSQTIRFPGPQTLLTAGDRLLAVGDEEEDAAFEQLLTGSAPALSGVPGRWFTVPPGCWLGGQTLAAADLRRRHSVLVQAVQHGSRLIRFPNGDTRIYADDRLLLCGSDAALIRFADTICNSTQQPALEPPD